MGFSRFFGILMLDKKDNEIKFGMVVSKKISKKAVERNKIRRRLMTVLGKNLKKFALGKRVLFLVKKDLLGVKPKEIEEELEKYSQRLLNPGSSFTLEKGERKTN